MKTNAMQVFKQSIQLVLVFMVSLSVNLANAEEMNKPAPDFTLKSRSGENLRLSDFKGQVVMVNVWASWCAPCRQEMPLLEDMSKNTGVSVSRY